MKSTVETRNVQVPIPLKEPRAEDDSQSEPVSLGQYETLKRQLAESQHREAELLAQLAAIKSDNDASRHARRAALNLMEDAILARRAEQQAFAERQQVESAFRESEARYRTLFDSMNEGYCIVEQDLAASESVNFVIVDANAAFAGGAQDGLIGRSIGDILLGESGDWNHICQEVLDKDLPQKIEAKLANQRVYEIIAFRVKGHSSRRVAFLLNDVTERKLAEKAHEEAAHAKELLARLKSDLEIARVKREAYAEVRVTKERFQSFMDQNGAASFIKDDQGRYVFVNRTLELRFDRKIEDWIGKTDFDFFPAEDAAVYRQNELSVLAAKSAGQFNEAAIETDGRHEYLSFKFPMRDLHGNWFVGGTAFDITNQRLAERALEVNEQRLRALAAQITRVENQERRRLASILHEDVQQLLIAMKMRTATIGAQNADHAIQEHIEVLNELLAKAIETVRTLSRELVPPTLYQLGLGAGLEWLAERFEERHGLKVAVEIDAGADPATDMLRDVMFHIARELLMNVVKHAQTDHAEIHLARKPHHLELVVRDEGVGLDPQQSWECQDSFGLFQIRERLVSLGGIFELCSGPGKGVEAIVSVPLEAE